MWREKKALGNECVSNIAYPHTSTAEIRHLPNRPAQYLLKVPFLHNKVWTVKKPVLVCKEIT